MIINNKPEGFSLLIFIDYIYVASIPGLASNAQVLGQRNIMMILAEVPKIESFSTILRY